MIKHSKWMLAASASLMLTLAVSTADVSNVGSESGAGASSVASRQLLDLDIEPGSPGMVSVELAVDGAVPFDSFVLAGPDRLVIDLPGVVSRLKRYQYPVATSGVHQVRAAQHQMEPFPVTRVVFDLEGPISYAIQPETAGLTVRFDRNAQVSVWEPRGEEMPTETAAVAPSETAPTDSGNVDDLIREMEARHEGGADEAETAADATVAEALPVEEDDSARVVEADAIDKLIASTEPARSTKLYQQGQTESSAFQTRTIVTEETVYSGKPISLNLVEADVKQVFRLFHEISGLNFVLDPSVTGRVTIVLDNVPWDQALDIILKNNGLDKVLENNVIRIASTQKLAQEAAARKQLKEAKELEVEPITITRTLSYAKADEVERVIRDSGVLTTRGRVIVDPRTNTLIVSDIPKKMEPVDTLISTLDAETPQVMIEARVVETSRDYVRDLGIVWGFEAIADASRGTSTGLTFPHNAAVRYGLNLPGEGGASTLAFRFSNVIDSFTLDLALSALETEGYGRVLSSPKVATQNNERAEIEQGVRIPIVNTTATEINVEFVSASLRMIVTPQITAEGTVILEVEVENNSPDFVNTAGGIPSIRTQRAQTKVLISDGGTTVIGGIFVVNEGQSEVGVPWFRKIPVFGWLFKQQNITNQNRELLIFITPKIMRLA